MGKITAIQDSSLRTRVDAPFAADASRSPRSPRSPSSASFLPKGPSQRDQETEHGIGHGNWYNGGDEADLEFPVGSCCLGTFAQ